MDTRLIKKVELPKPGKYVVAVSGGVDSVALLHLLANSSTKYELTVAHFDHGIRPDSDKDRKFVENLAQQYNLSFEGAEGKLGKDAAEEQAREARYAFLNRVKKDTKATAIITAHHLDDRIETMVFNVVRGTGVYGLAPLRTSREYLRPLQNVLKKELYTYAKFHNLKWHEDPTNQDITLARNYIRHEIVPLMEKYDPHVKRKLSKHLQKFDSRNDILKSRMSELLPVVAELNDKTVKFKRDKILELDQVTARNLIYFVLSERIGTEIVKADVERLEHFCKTAPEGNEMVLPGETIVVASAKSIDIQFR